MVSIGDKFVNVFAIIITLIALVTAVMGNTTDAWLMMIFSILLHISTRIP